MTLKPLAHRSAQALLSSPTFDPQSAAHGALTLRDPASSRALWADAPGSRADFADTLREHAKASGKGARTDPSSKAAHEQTTPSEPDASAPEAEQADEVSTSSAAEADATHTDAQCDSAPSGNQTSTDDAANPTQTPDAAPAQVSAAVEVKTQPATIQDLNALLLQGQAPPRFALVSPEQQPGAIARDKTSTRSSRDQRPASSAASMPPSDQPQVPGSSANDAPASSPESSARHADSARSAPAPHDAPASSSRSEHGAPVPASASAPAAAQPPTPTPPPASPTAPTQPAPQSTNTSTANAAARISGSHALLDRLSAPSAKTNASSAPRSDADAPAVTAQVQRGLAAALNQKTGAVTLRLTPETLGQLKIQVKVSEGSITASFEVSSAKTRDTLNRSLDTLRQGLKDKGLEVTEFKITLAPTLPQRDLGLDPIAHPAPAAHDAPTTFNPDGQPMTAHDGGSSGHSSHDYARATSASASATEPAETAVDLAALSPDLAGETMGRSRYVALPGGRLGLVALA